MVCNELFTPAGPVSSNPLYLLSGRKITSTVRAIFIGLVSGILCTAGSSSGTTFGSAAWSLCLRLAGFWYGRMSSKGGIAACGASADQRACYGFLRFRLLNRLGKRNLGLMLLLIFC